MPLIPVPIYGVRVSANPSKWLFDIIGGRHKQNYEEFSVAGFIFTYVQKYFSGSLTGGIASIAPPHPYGSATGCDLRRTAEPNEVPLAADSCAPK